MSSSIKVVLFESKTLSDGTHPVMLRITKNRKSKYFNLGFKCRTKEWDKKNGLFKKNHINYKKRNLILASHVKKARKVVDEFHELDKDFTFKQFEREFKGEKVKKDVTVFDYFSERIEDMKKAKRIGNARVYREVQSSFFKFVKDKKIHFPDLDLDMLEKYETWLRSRGGTGGGIGVKMRTIRAVYNDAIRKGYAKQEDYPFKHYDMSRLKSTGIKRALTRDEVRLVEQLDLEQYPHQTNFRHYFIFSYFSRGMNFIDMMKLQWSNIVDGRITYIRSKTGRLFVIKVLKPIQKILDHYESLPNDTNYVFPILLHEGLEEFQIQHRKKKTLKQYNKGLKEIAEIVGIDKTLTSYVARHSYATNLKQAGVNISIISESMGHANLDVTEHYLKEFENEVIDQATERLL